MLSTGGPDQENFVWAALRGHLRERGRVDGHNLAVEWRYAAAQYERQQIIDRAARHRLPAIFWHRTYVLDGGLMAYGENEREVPRRLAVYVDKIL